MLGDKYSFPLPQIDDHGDNVLKPLWCIHTECNLEDDFAPVTRLLIASLSISTTSTDSSKVVIYDLLNNDMNRTTGNYEYSFGDSRIPISLSWVRVDCTINSNKLYLLSCYANGTLRLFSEDVATVRTCRIGYSVSPIRQARCTWGLNGNNTDNSSKQSQHVLWILYDDGHFLAVPISLLFEESHKDFGAVLDRMTGSNSVSGSSSADFAAKEVTVDTSISNVINIKDERIMRWYLDGANNVNFISLIKTKNSNRYSMAVSDADVLASKLKIEKPGDKYLNPIFNFSEQLEYGVICAGKDPTVALYVLDRRRHEFPSEAGMARIATLVASKFASRMASMAKDWITASLHVPNTANQTSQKQWIPRVVESKMKLEDKRRDVWQMTGADPSGRYFATVDNFGRITIFDTFMFGPGMRAIRMFKGFRDAQIGWLTAPESWPGQWDSTNTSMKGKVIWGDYLIVFAPQKGMIQAWRMPDGPWVICIRLATHRMEAYDYSLQTSSNVITGHSNVYLVSVPKQKKNDKGNSYACATQIILGQKGLENIRTHVRRSHNQQDGFLLHQLRGELMLMHKQVRKEHHVNEVIYSKNTFAIAALDLIKKIQDPDVIERALTIVDQEMESQAHKQEEEDSYEDFHIQLAHNSLKVLRRSLSDMNSKFRPPTGRSISVSMKNMDDNRSICDLSSTRTARSSLLTLARSHDDVLLEHNLAQMQTLVKQLKQRLNILLCYKQLAKSESRSENKVDSSTTIADCRVGKCIIEWRKTLVAAEEESLKSKSEANHMTTSGHSCSGNSNECKYTKIQGEAHENTIPITRFSLLHVYGLTFTKRRKKEKPFIGLKTKSKFASLLYAPLHDDVFALRDIDALQEAVGMSPFESAELFGLWWFQQDISDLLSASGISNPSLRWLHETVHKFVDNIAQAETAEETSDKPDAHVDIKNSPSRCDAMMDETKGKNNYKSILDSLYEDCMKSHKLCHVLLLSTFLLHVCGSELGHVLLEPQSKIFSRDPFLNRTSKSVSKMVTYERKRWELVHEKANIALFFSCCLKHICGISIGLFDEDYGKINQESKTSLWYLIAQEQIIVVGVPISLGELGSWRECLRLRIPSTVDVDKESVISSVRLGSGNTNFMKGSSGLNSISMLFPLMVYRSFDKICVHRSLILAEKSVSKKGNEICEESARFLYAAVESITTVDDNKARGGVALRIWNSVACPYISNAFKIKKISSSSQLHPNTMLDVIQSIIRLLDILRAVVLSQERENETKKNSGMEVGPVLTKPDSSVEVCGTVKEKTNVITGYPCADDDFVNVLIEEFSEVENKINLDALKVQITVLHIFRASISYGNSLKLNVALLFPEGTKILCPEALTATVPAGSSVEQETVDLRRMKLVVELLELAPNRPAGGMAVALSLGLDTQKVRCEHIKMLYEQGFDSMGEEALTQMDYLEDVSLGLLAVARRRMALILRGVQQSRTDAHLLAVVSADTSRWIMASLPPKTTEDEKCSIPPPSLSKTLILLRRLDSILPRTTSVRKRAMALSRAAESLWHRIQES